jgi:hypothetical protein
MICLTYYVLCLFMIGSFMGGSGITLVLSGIWIKYNKHYIVNIEWCDLQ